MGDKAKNMVKGDLVYFLDCDNNIVQKVVLLNDPFEETMIIADSVPEGDLRTWWHKGAKLVL